MLHVYLAVGGDTAADLATGGAAGVRYSDYPDGGDYAGSGAYGSGNGNGGLRGTYFNRCVFWQDSCYATSILAL